MALLIRAPEGLEPSRAKTRCSAHRMALSDSQTGRHPFRRRSGRDPQPIPSLPHSLRSPSLHAVLNTPVDRIRCSLVGELRDPARVSSLSVQPSPLSGRVGVHIVTFEACSSFTRVTAYTVAHPPFVGFIARLRPDRFLGSGARKLPSSTNNLLGWVLPPLVICAVEAHPLTPLSRKQHKVVAGRLTRRVTPNISVDPLPSL